VKRKATVLSTRTVASAATRPSRRRSATARCTVRSLTTMSRVGQQPPHHDRITGGCPAVGRARRRPHRIRQSARRRPGLHPDRDALT